MRTTSIPGAMALALISAGTALAASTPRPDEIPAYCAKAASQRADKERDTCVSQITALPSSQVYKNKKTECDARRSTYQSRYVGECTKQLGRSLLNVSYWPVR